MPGGLHRPAGGFRSQDVLDVLSGVGALDVAAVDGHGEVLAAGVLPLG